MRRWHCVALARIAPPRVAIQLQTSEARSACSLSLQLSARGQVNLHCALLLGRGVVCLTPCVRSGLVSCVTGWLVLARAARLETGLDFVLSFRAKNELQHYAARSLTTPLKQTVAAIRFAAQNDQDSHSRDFDLTFRGRDCRQVMFSRAAHIYPSDSTHANKHTNTRTHTHAHTTEQPHNQTNHTHKHSWAR